MRPRALKLQPASLSSSCGVPFHDGVALACAAWICAIDSCSASTWAWSSSILAWASSSCLRLGDRRVGGRVRRSGSRLRPRAPAPGGGADEQWRCRRAARERMNYASSYSLSPDLAACGEADARRPWAARIVVRDERRLFELGELERGQRRAPPAATWRGPPSGAATRPALAQIAVGADRAFLGELGDEGADRRDRPDVRILDVDVERTGARIFEATRWSA